jgi:hypothetical protein
MFRRSLKELRRTEEEEEEEQEQGAPVKTTFRVWCLYRYFVHVYMFRGRIHNTAFS